MKENTQDEPKRITIAEVRSTKGFEHVSDEEAIEIIDSIQELAAILVEHFKLYRKDDKEY